MVDPSNPHLVRRATIKTLSKAAGVAASTVSRALNGDRRISAETRDRITELAEKLGYTPNALARTLSSGRSRLVGLVVGAPGNPFYTDVLHEAAEQAARRGMRLLIIHAGAGPIEKSTSEAMLQYQVDGCLMSSVELPSQVSAICAQHGGPIIMVNRAARMKSNSVICDNLHGSAQLAELLLEKGRQRFAVVGTSAPTSTGQERQLGFAERVRAAGCGMPLLLDGHSTYEGGYDMAREIAMLPPPARPDAVFAVSDIMAFGLLDGFRDLGIKVPADVAVVGFDGLAAAARPMYDLTTVQQPLKVMMIRAFDMLTVRIRDRTVPDEAVTLKGTLVVRGSSG
jgi:DNA-binding LacI/PurR family transcriptional regulator